MIHSLSEEKNDLSEKYHQVISPPSPPRSSSPLPPSHLLLLGQLKEEIFDLQGTVMMAAAEVRHEAEKELAANRSELNLKV